MKRSFLTVTFLFFAFSYLSGENYFIDLYDNQTVTTCRGTLLPTWLCDDAFGKKVYCNNETYTVTFFSGTPGLKLRISFLPLTNAGYPSSNVFQTENGKDFLKIYDGMDTTGIQLANLSGSIASPFTYTSNSGYLTVKFTSDASFNDYGWYAILGCEPQSCNNNPPSNNECIDAPLICDIDGYCGNTSGWYSPDHYTDLASNYSGPFCGTIENNGWIKFLPIQSAATLKITSSNCDAFDAGIQAMMFATSDCNTFTQVSTCASQIGSSGEFTISNTVPLVVGTPYYLMIDGYAGNTCDYVVNAVVGIRVLTVAGPPSICEGSSTILTLTGSETGSTYSWEPASAITGSTTDSIITASPDTTTTYTCAVTAPGFCSTKYKSFTLVVTPKRPVSVSISPSANPVCQGTAVSFTAIPIMGGTNPTYKWHLNGVPAGSNSATFNPSGLTPGTYQVYVVMTSNDTCIVGTSVDTSDIVSLTVISSAVSVSISASANPTCSGAPVTFTAIPVNGGSAPTFQWYLNGSLSGNAIPGATGSTYTTSSLVSGNTIRVRMVSNATCRATTTVFSNTITMTVLPKPTASASFVLSECPDTNGYAASLSANNPFPGTGLWSIVSGPGNISNTTNPSSSVTGLSVSGLPTVVKWRVTGSNGCRDSVLLTITPKMVNNNLISTYSPYYCITCPLKDGNKYYYYDPDAKLAAIIQDVSDGVSQGPVEICIYLDYNVNGLPTASDIDTAPDTLGYAMPFLPRHWTINVPSPGDVQVTLFFTEAEVQALKNKAAGTPYQFSSTPSLLSDKYNNGASAYIPPGTDGANTTNPPIISYPTQALPYWGFTYNTSGYTTNHLHPKPAQLPPLPVELISFAAFPEDKHISLEWYTASELNSDHFEIQRSTDANTFYDLGQIQGGGNSSALLSYRYDDSNVIPGVRYYYRLKQVDFDGTYSYSDIVSAILSSDKSIVVGAFAPNPTIENTKLNIVSINHQLVRFKLFSLSGEHLLEEEYNLEKGSNELSFDLHQLEPGVYFGHFSTEEGDFIRKVIIIQ